MTQYYGRAPQMDNYCSGAAGSKCTPQGGPNALGGADHGTLVDNPPGSGGGVFNQPASTPSTGTSTRQARLNAERRARVLRREADAAGYRARVAARAVA